VTEHAGARCISFAGGGESDAEEQGTNSRAYLTDAVSGMPDIEGGLEGTHAPGEGQRAFLERVLLPVRIAKAVVDSVEVSPTPRKRLPESIGEASATQWIARLHGRWLDRSPETEQVQSSNVPARRHDDGSRGLAWEEPILGSRGEEPTAFTKGMEAARGEQAIDANYHRRSVAVLAQLGKPSQSVRDRDPSRLEHISFWVRIVVESENFAEFAQKIGPESGGAAGPGGFG
jgi:hypothetical protein